MPERGLEPFAIDCALQAAWRTEFWIPEEPEYDFVDYFEAAAARNLGLLAGFDEIAADMDRRGIIPAVDGEQARLVTDGGSVEEVTERGRYGDLQILVGELTDSYQPVDDDGNVKAKVWESDSGERRLYLRVRDHDDGRRFNEYSVDLDKSEGDVWCAKCGEVTVDPSDCDLSPPVCKSCRYEMDKPSVRMEPDRGASR